MLSHIKPHRALVLAMICFTGETLHAQVRPFICGVGSNGHAYEAVAVTGGISWSSARSAALARGGDLATLTTPQENAFVFALIDTDAFWMTFPNGYRAGPWLGARQVSGGASTSGWIWLTGETWSYTNWDANQPNNAGGVDQTFLQFGTAAGRGPTWNDQINSTNPPCRGYVIEWPSIFATQPLTQSVCPGGARSFRVLLMPGLLDGPFTFRWRQNGQPIDLSLNPSAATPTLTLTNVNALSAGDYDCVVTNPCGSVVSNAANLFVGCSSPANVAGPGQEPTCDGVLTADDIIVFLNWWFAADPRADIARQGQVPQPDGAFTADDLIYYVSLFFQGC